MADTGSQVLFWLCIFGMLAILLLFLAGGLFGVFKQRRDNEHSLYNRTVYQDQFSELESDLARGAITKKQFDDAKEELERRILEDAQNETEVQERKTSPWITVAILTAVPVMALCLYFLIGNPSLMGYAPYKENLAKWDSTGNLTLGQGKEVTVSELRSYLNESPKDARAWVQLAYLYTQQRDIPDALDALNKAFDLSPDKVGQDSSLITERAMLMLETRDAQLIPAARAELEKALEINGENKVALEVLGMVAFNQKDYNKAISAWSQLLSQYQEGSSQYLELLDWISEAKNRSEMMGGFPMDMR